LFWLSDPAIVGGVKPVVEEIVRAGPSDPNLRRGAGTRETLVSNQALAAPILLLAHMAVLSIMPSPHHATGNRLDRTNPRVTTRFVYPADVSVKTIKNSPFRSTAEANRMVEDNIRLAYDFFSKKMSNPNYSNMDRDEVESVILNGFFMASRLWNPDRAKFTTCAYLVMNSELRSYVRQRKLHPYENIPVSSARCRRAAASDSVDARDELRVGMEELKDLEKLILDARFNRGHTLKAVSELVGVSSERVRQIQEKAMAKVRERLAA
jgi:RNA polymerase sigma factor (sigma-70 family)